VPNVLLVAHRRWGKDEVGLADCAVRAAQVPGNYYYCLPEQEHARRAIWSSINPRTGRRRVDEHFPEGFRIGTFKEQEMAIEVHAMGGKRSRVQFLGSDNYDAIVGGSPRGVYFSEWALADPQAVAMLRPIVEENGGFFRFFTTPRGRHNHVYRQMEAQRGKPGWAVHYATAEETSVFTPEQLRTVQQEYIDLYGAEVGAALYRQEYLCSFEDVTPGSFYGDLLQELEKKGRVGEVEAWPEEPVYAACDLGYSDATAIWYAQIGEENIRLIAYDEFRKMDVPSIVRAMRAHPWNYGGVLLPHDAVQHELTSGETVESMLTRHGFTCYTQRRPTEEHIQVASVRQMLPRCRFAADACERGLTCLKSYHASYRETHDVWSVKAVHDWSSHAAKAFAVLAFFAPALTPAKSRQRTIVEGGAWDAICLDRPKKATLYGWMK
jgi:hypothetical protein